MPVDSVLAEKLQRFGKVLNATYALPDPARAFGRGREVQVLLDRLAQPGGRSFVLLGPSGCGKSAILHEVVGRAESCIGGTWAFLETSASMLLAGTRYLGELETRVKELIDLARWPARVVLTFTDIFTLFEAGRTAQSDVSIGGFLSPFIQGGELTLAGECTAEQFRMGFERNPTFQRLFYALRVEEQPAAEARRVLRAVADERAARWEMDTGVRLETPDGVLGRVFELADCYFPGQCHPGKSIQLLDEAIALATSQDSLAQPTGPPQPSGPVVRPQTPVVLRPQTVVRALERFTGIPSTLLDDSEPLDLDEVRKFFEARVLGQTDAVSQVVDLITLIKAGVTDPGKPMGVLFFVGPTGVGKTELARALAEFIFGSPERMIRFDMSEYKDYNSFEKLIGNPQAKEGSSMQAGNLVTRVRQQPFAVILLDEIEKAHANIFDIFLQVFDAGRLTDPVGQTTNFTQTIVIMTLNVGSDLRREGGFGFRQEQPASLGDDVMDAMRNHFRPEFLNRLDRIVLFQSLDREHMRLIAQRELGKVLLRSGIVRRNMSVDVDPSVIDILLAEGFSREYGARHLKRVVEQLALLPIARQMVRLQGGAGQPLLRLLPAGERIKATIVEDQPRREAEAVTRAASIIDPVRKRKIRYSADELADESRALRAGALELEASRQGARLRERKAELVARTGAVDFWDNPAAAKQVLGEVHRVERLVEAVDRVVRRAADLEQFVEQARRQRRAGSLAEAAQRLQEVRRHLEVVRYSVECRGPLDRYDAFVTIHLIEAQPAENDVVGLVGDMYVNWARSKGFETTIVHEEMFSPKHTRELALLVEGVSVYGILQGEEGIHEMVYGKTSKSARVARHVKVRVLPVHDGDVPGVHAGDLAVTRAAAKGEGKRVKRYKSLVTAVHQPSRMEVRVKNGLDGDDALRLATEFLQAELARREAPPALPASGAGDTEQAVRKYTLRPTQAVKDLRTGISTTGLIDVRNGALDEFLHAYVALRGHAPETLRGRGPEELRGHAPEDLPAVADATPRDCIAERA